MDFIHILGWIVVICAIGWRVNNSRELTRKVAKDIRDANPNISKEDLDKKIDGFKKDLRDEGLISTATMFWIIVGGLLLIYFLIPMFTSVLTNPSEPEDNCYGMGQTYTC